LNDIYTLHCEELEKLSEKLENYNVPAKFNEELKDALGRKIINNRFKILDSVYNSVFKQ
jgi:uncharacterized protein Veg